LTRQSPADTALEFALQVERFYSTLIQGAGRSDEPPSLGGKLLYAGELDSQGRALLVAANIAGAASLAATADPAAQKQAIRDGVADFLVNSLDEALRILKNEIRKRETVAVCIAGTPDSVQSEMRERGVVPDLLAPLQLISDSAGEAVLSWRVSTAPAQWLPKLDAIALSCLEQQGGTEVEPARRWLRLAPRYLGRIAQGTRVLRCGSAVATEMVARVRRAVESGEIATEVLIGLIGGGDIFRLRPSPGGPV
jgi:Urocanase Rossmann-like domain